jgi:hypothetical protein
MLWIWSLLLIAGGALGASGFIIDKKPSAAQLIAKIAPFQAIIGAAMLGIAVYFVLVQTGIAGLLLLLKFWKIAGTAYLIGLFCSVVLGVLFALPLISKDDSLRKKLVKFQLSAGVSAIIAGFILVLIQLAILKPPGM